MQVDRNLMLYLPRLTVLVTIEPDRPGAWFPGLLGPYQAWCPGICLSTASAAAASTATTTMHSPAHRRLRQALQIQRCTARPLFTLPGWARYALRSHDHQRALHKLSVHAVALCPPMCASCSPLHCPGATRGDRGERKAFTD